MSEDFMLTSVLEFEDRFEGQIYTIGSREHCENMAELFSAISYSGTGVVLSSRIVIDQVKPENVGRIAVGFYWRQMKSRTGGIIP